MVVWLRETEHQSELIKILQYQHQSLLKQKERQIKLTELTTARFTSGNIANNDQSFFFSVVYLA